MLHPERPVVVSPDGALCLPVFSHFLIDNSLLSLSLSLSLCLSLSVSLRLLSYAHRCLTTRCNPRPRPLSSAPAPDPPFGSDHYQSSLVPFLIKACTTANV